MSMDSLSKDCKTEVGIRVSTDRLSKDCKTEVGIMMRTEQFEPQATGCPGVLR